MDLQSEIRQELVETENRLSNWIDTPSWKSAIMIDYLAMKRRKLFDKLLKVQIKEFNREG